MYQNTVKNARVLVFVAIAFIAGTITSSTLAVADTSTQGQPFQALQAAIQALQTQLGNLQTQVNNIQLTPGPQGPAGATGPQGPAGPAGSTTNFYLREKIFPISPHSEFQFPPLSVQCSPGDKIISGGYDNIPLQVTITGSFPNSVSSPQEWDVRGTNPTDYSTSVTLIAVCAH